MTVICEYVTKILTSHGINTAVSCVEQINLFDTSIFYFTTCSHLTYKNWKQEYKSLLFSGIFNYFLVVFKIQNFIVVL